MSVPRKDLPIRSFGRKQGRKPKGELHDAMEKLLPELEIKQDQPITSLSKLFSFPHSYFAMEIGFGRGEHLYQQALSAPETGFIGCEPFLNGVAYLLYKIRRGGTGNIRIWHDDARILMDKIPNESLDKVFILFPDPWPKVRHSKRRLVNKELLNQLARIMKPGALLRIATDHDGYAAWSLAHILQHSCFEWRVTSKKDWKGMPENWVVTRYQKKALAGEVTTYIDCIRR
jgi:tRNA (guanine-N7-)-methyltransferase